MRTRKARRRGSVGAWEEGAHLPGLIILPVRETITKAARQSRHHVSPVEARVIARTVGCATVRAIIADDRLESVRVRERGPLRGLGPGGTLRSPVLARRTAKQARRWWR